MAPWLITTINILTALTMLFGLFGLIIPIFPGNVVMWVAALIYGLVFGFGKLGGILFALIMNAVVAFYWPGATWTGIVSFVIILSGFVIGRYIGKVMEWKEDDWDK